MHQPPIIATAPLAVTMIWPPDRSGFVLLAAAVGIELYDVPEPGGVAASVKVQVAPAQFCAVVIAWQPSSAGLDASMSRWRTVASDTPDTLELTASREA